MKCLEEYDESYEELRTKYDNLVNDHDNLVSRHEKLSIEHEELKVSLKELEYCLNEKVPSNIPSSNDGVPNVAKVDASTSCQDLLDMPCPSPCNYISMLETNLLKEMRSSRWIMPSCWRVGRSTLRAMRSLVK